MKTSITAIESASWHTPLVLRGDHVSCVRQAARLGYDGIELHLLDSDAVDRESLKTALRDSGISLTSIGTGPSYSQQRIFLTHGEEEVRKEAVRRMKSHIHLGAETGAVVIIGLMKGQKKDCPDEKRYQEYFLSGMEACIAEAERQKVMLAFEVIDRFESDWLNTVDEGLELLARFESDYLTLHLDTFHMNIEESDLVQCIRRAKGKIGHVHVADSDRWYPGHAHYDFASMFKALKEVEYDGAVALESFLYPDPETAAKLGLAKMKEFI